jgi:hypothetical protein
MPNWCNNFLSFSGENAETAIQLFEELSERCSKTGEGCVPSFIVPSEQLRYFFDVSVDEGAINFESKWDPPLQTLERIGKLLDVAWFLEYVEYGNGVYGKATFSSLKGLADYPLDNADFEQYVYDEENDNYIYEGQEYECEDTILEILWDKKYKK